MAKVNGVAEFLEKTGKLRHTADKVAALKHNNSPILKTVLKLAFDPTVEWALDAGPINYKPNNNPDMEYAFIKNWEQLQYFVKSPWCPELSKVKRELMFIDFLETIDNHDAEMMCSLKDQKKLHCKGITIEHVTEAFPDLLTPAPH